MGRVIYEYYVNWVVVSFNDYSCFVMFLEGMFLCKGKRDLFDIWFGNYEFYMIMLKYFNIYI